MERAYAYDNLITERTIDTHVKRIRKKFRDAGHDPIETVHGVGYKLRT
jgi:two-component system OmpR family response regulator